MVYESISNGEYGIGSIIFSNDISDVGIGDGELTLFCNSSRSILSIAKEA
jgi:hypothetical protein